MNISLFYMWVGVYIHAIEFLFVCVLLLFIGKWICMSNVNEEFLLYGAVFEQM